MKKLHLNKVFHWLYAFAMFLPIFAFFYYFLAVFGTGADFSNFGFDMVFASVNTCLFDFAEGSMGLSISNVFVYVSSTLLGCDGDSASYFLPFVCNLLTYWVCVSLIYLVFDVLMLPINIAHHWIDKGSDRL